MAYIPPIVVPDFLSMPPQQWQLQKQLPTSLSPSRGIQVKPLSCENPKLNANGTTAQVIKTDQGTLLIDEGNGGLFSSDQLTVSLNDDGTGVLVAKLDDQTQFHSLWQRHMAQRQHHSHHSQKWLRHLTR